MRIDKKKFEEVCKEICSEDWYKREDYLSMKKDKTLTNYLKLSVQGVALKYFPHVQHKSKLAFPSVIVRRIATKMNLYVTDIIRF